MDRWIVDRHVQYLKKHGVHIKVGEIESWCGNVHKEEKKYIHNFGLKRSKEFSAGRRIIRSVFEEIGADVGAIGVDKGGAPVFPVGGVGSISHGERYCVVIAGYQCKARFIGVDIERVGRIDKSAWTILFTGYEIYLLNCISERDVDRFSTLIYSSKESYIKLHWSKNNESCDMHDINVIHIIELHKDFYCVTLNVCVSNEQKDKKKVYASCFSNNVLSHIVE